VTQLFSILDSADGLGSRHTCIRGHSIHRQFGDTTNMYACGDHGLRGGPAARRPAPICISRALCNRDCIEEYRELWGAVKQVQYSAYLFLCFRSCRSCRTCFYCSRLYLEYLTSCCQFNLLYNPYPFQDNPQHGTYRSTPEDPTIHHGA
jgi:hypothetical protein